MKEEIIGIFANFTERNSERERELELALPSRFSVLLTLQVSESGFSLDKITFFCHFTSIQILSKKPWNVKFFGFSFQRQRAKAVNQLPMLKIVVPPLDLWTQIDKIHHYCTEKLRTQREWCFCEGQHWVFIQVNKDCSYIKHELKKTHMHGANVCTCMVQMFNMYRSIPIWLLVISLMGLWDLIISWFAHWQWELIRAWFHWLRSSW